MKNLANCPNREFLQQAAKIRAPFKAWLETTGIPAIRARRPADYDTLTDAEKINADIAQGRANFADMVAAALEKDFDNTVNLICLFTFTDPADFDSVPRADWMSALIECLQSDTVKDFFTLSI